MNVFLIVWLTGWTAGGILLLDQYQRGEKMENGTPIPPWFVGIYWLTEVGVAFFLSKVFFERRSFHLAGDTLSFETSLFGVLRKKEFPKTAITKVTQVKDGGTGEDSFPTWGLKVEAGKSYGLIFRQPHEQSDWLGRLIADWAEKRFDPVPKK